MGTKKPETTEIEQRILDALKEGPLTSPDIASRLERSPQSVRPRLTEMFRGGRLQRTGDESGYTYSLPNTQPDPATAPVLPPQTSAGLSSLLQDTSPLFGDRARVSMPIPQAMQEQLATAVLQAKITDRQAAPDQCDYLALGALLVLRILEAGGSDAEQLKGILVSMRDETRNRQSRR